MFLFTLLLNKISWYFIYRLDLGVKKMQNKKILSTLIIALLTFSMIFAFIPMGSAIAVTSVTPNTGPVGTAANVTGTEATPFALVEIYWENLAGAKLGNVSADEAGDYGPIEIVIPEDFAGAHWVVAKDVATGSAAGETFTITPEITLTPTSGLPGDSVDVSGTGFNSTQNITLTFEKTISGEVIDDTPNGSKLEFSGTLEYYPIKNGTLEVNATLVTTGDIQISDDGIGGLSGTNVTGTIAYDTGGWYLNFTEAPQDATNITANYKVEIDITPSPPPKTSALGSFDTSFTVPTVPYGSYLVNATDETGNFDTATFTVTATITLTPDEGPTGTVVATTGKGFTKTADLPVTITVDGVTAPQVAPIKTKADGTFTGQFIMPTVTVAVHNVSASDGTISGKTSFNVTETTTITLDPVAGQPGWSITIEGVYFTAIAGTEVTVKFEELTVKTLSTNATGGFKDTFDVPSFESGPYIVNATDENDLKDTADFNIAITLIFLTPTEGPTGTSVAIAGYGFTKDTGITANVTIGTMLVQTGISVNVTYGRFTSTFIVPTLPAATYTVTAEDSKGLTAKTSFEVTKATELIITPSSASVGYEVSLVGNYFSGNSAIDVFLYNSTDSWLLTNKTGSFTTFKNGTFVATFIVPDYDLGDYFINATDPYLFPDNLKLIYVLDVPFSIVTITVEMNTRSLEYLQGDTISFYIKSTFNYNVTIAIEDPTEYPATVSIPAGDWLPMGDSQVVPYGKATFTLPSDAKTGTWNWTATIGTETKTGTFSVVVRPTLTTILDKLDALDATLVSLDGTVATIDSNVGEIKVSVDDINLKVVAINGTVATIETDLGTIQGTVTSIDDNVATIQTDVGTVKADVSDIVEAGVTVDLTVVWIAAVFSILAFLAAIAAAYMLRSKLA